MVVNRDVLDQETNVLEYLIDLGVKGNHLLFDNSRIREAFGKNLSELAESGRMDVSKINEAIRGLLAKPGFDEKKEYIESLPQEIQDILIILYFQLIDRNMMLKSRITH